MKTYSMWISGNSVVAQDPQRSSNSWYDASTSNFTMRGDDELCWFQFSIPTPTRVANKVAWLNRFMILCRTNKGVRIARIDLWDGPKLIGRYDVIIVGDHSQDISPVNVLDLADRNEAYQMNWGLTASIGVRPVAGGNITFVSVGADFQADT